jgi:hypothetical protein
MSMPSVKLKQKGILNTTLLDIPSPTASEPFMTLSLRQDSVNILQLQIRSNHLISSERRYAPDIHGFLDNRIVKIKEPQEQLQRVSNCIKTLSLVQT